MTNKTTSELLQKQSRALNIALTKLAELAAEAEVLADGLEEAQSENTKLTEEVGEKTEALAEKAVDPGTTEAISEASKDLLIEAVATIDPELADALNDEIDLAEEGEEGLTGDKIASAVVSIFESLGEKEKNKPLYSDSGTSRKTASKKSGNHWEDASNATLDRLLND